jgi:hypothetical protein
MHDQEQTMRISNRLSLPLLGLTCVLIASTTVALLALGAQVAGRQVGGPVYTVAALRAQVAQDPEAWMGRTVQVRALASVCTAWLTAAHVSPCLNWRPALTDPHDDGDALPLVSGPVPPPVALLRRLPLIGQMAPAPQSPRWDGMDVYRVQLHALSCGPPQQPECYEALLLDAAPGLPKED